MNADRRLAASLFAVAACINAEVIALSLSPDGFGLGPAGVGPKSIALLLCSAAGGGAAGLLAAPTLAEEARRGAPLWKGAVLGMFVGWLGWVLAAIGLAVLSAEGSMPFPEMLGFPVLAPLIAFFYLFNFPWSMLTVAGVNGVAGALFYYFRRGSVLEAVRPDSRHLD